MYKGVFRALVVGAALVAATGALANEPDGRVAFRYIWPDRTEDSPDAPRLRLSLTAFVHLAETRLSATLPAGIEIALRAAGRAPTPWPDEGLEIGDIAAGQTIVIELDIAKPPRGGGIVSFVLQASEDGHAVREGVGVPVGEPGTTPTLRNGAAEFPASREDPAP